MARIRIAGTRLNSFDEVDGCLAEIGSLDRELGLLEHAQNESIDTLKASTKAACAPLLERKAALEAAIKEFCEANRAEFAKAKTRQLTFGAVGFRLSTKVIVKRVADTLQALKDLGLPQCIRVKEELDKEAMKTLPVETLAQVGAALKQEDAFGYEVKREELPEAA